MDRKEQKSLFFFQVFCSALSSFSSSSQRKKLASAHRSAVMWFQCLGPCGIVPSGGEPLRLCWHIATPIINSRSALSFLWHLSSFLLTAPFVCFACALISAPGSFTSTHPQHFSSNLLSQQSYLFFPHSPLRHTLYWMTTTLTKELLTLLSPARIWSGNVSLNGSILDSKDDQTGEDLMIQLICGRDRLSLTQYNPQENYTITFKLGDSNQKTGLIDFFLPTSTSQGSSSSIPLLFHWLFFFSFFFHSSYFLSDPTTIFKFFPFLSALHSSSVLRLSIFYLFNLTFYYAICLWIDQWNMVSSMHLLYIKDSAV